MTNCRKKYHTHLVSAIVSVYNCEGFIKGCLEDLENQTIADKIEIVIVNSNSQQNEETIIKGFQDRNLNIRYLKTNKRESIYAAWNRAIKASSGKYITNANSDDRHRRDSFEIMVRQLECNNDIGLVFGDCTISHIENETFESCKSKEYRIYPDICDRSSILLHGSISHQPMWRREIHDSFGFFCEDLEIAGDFEFWLRISDKVKFKHIKDNLGLYYWNPTSAERRNYELRQKEVISVLSKYIPDKASNYYLHKKVINSLSKLHSDCANYHLLRDELSLSRHSAIEGIRSNPRNIYNYYYYITSFLSKDLRKKFLD